MFGVVLFLTVPKATFNAAHYSYEVTRCEDARYVIGETTPFSDLSATGRDIFRSTLGVNGDYDSLESAPDFQYVTDAIRQTSIDYQGECYAMLAGDAGLSWGSYLSDRSSWLVSW